MTLRPPLLKVLGFYLLKSCYTVIVSQTGVFETPVNVTSCCWQASMPPNPGHVVQRVGRPIASLALFLLFSPFGSFWRFLVTRLATSVALRLNQLLDPLKPSLKAVCHRRLRSTAALGRPIGLQTPSPPV